jgi:uncharacterized protein (TIGR02300 family)
MVFLVRKRGGARIFPVFAAVPITRRSPGHPPGPPFRRAGILALTDQETAAKGTDFQGRGCHVAKSELGTKRIDPETGRKFYDLNKDPIVSPYTGKTYPRTYFDSANSKTIDEDEEVEEKEIDAEEEGAEVVSLEEADDEAKSGDDVPDIEDEEDVDLGDDDEDVFLEDEEEDDDDVSDIIGVGDDDEN